MRYIIVRSTYLLTYLLTYVSYTYRLTISSFTMDTWQRAGAREPWRQSRRGSDKISPNGAKIGLGLHKSSEVINWKWQQCFQVNTAVTISRRRPHIFNRLLLSLYCRLNAVEIYFDESSICSEALQLKYNWNFAICANSLTRAWTRWTVNVWMILW